jgi:hypothetical protein
VVDAGEQRLPVVTDLRQYGTRMVVLGGEDGVRLSARLVLRSAPSTLEQRVIETASLAYHLIRRGDEVRLKTQDFETPFGNTETHLECILEYLAMVGLEPKSRKST